MEKEKTNDIEIKDPVISGIGGQIKEIRKQKNWTIHDLAEATGLSKGMLSKIENGRTIPSITTLSAITQALQVDLSLFFNNIESNNGFKYIVKKKSEYGKIEKEGRIGFLYNFILSHKLLDFVLETVVLELEPGAKREKVSTDAYEFKYVLEGSVDYIIGDEVVSLEEGDSLLFDGRIPHLPVNKSDKKVKMLVVYLLFSGE
ncbi:MAG: XRE family transcriptional regulator [Microscillaceae bacterium]|nr:XRE family transcriptional regulator [Microscillaceae bacterium]